MPVTAERSGQETKGTEIAKEVQSQGQRQRQVEQCRKQQWARRIRLEAGTSHREQGEEHVHGCWKVEQTGSSSSSGWWRHLGNQKDQNVEVEVNSVESKYIKHDRWGQEWLVQL